MSARSNAAADGSARREEPVRGSTLSKVASFGGAVVALGAAAVVARVACPGGCPTCTTCVQSVVPATASAAAVGLALTNSYAAKRRSKRDRKAP